MGIGVFAGLCVTWAALWAYTRGVQEATLFWGSRLGEGNSLLPPTGMQDAITPNAQNMRNVLLIVSLLVLPVLGVVQFGWVIGLGGLFFSVITSSIIRVFLPGANSPFFFQVIVRGLMKRRAGFARSSDQDRLEAIDTVLGKLKSSFEAHHSGGVV